METIAGKWGKVRWVVPPGSMWQVTFYLKWHKKMLSAGGFFFIKIHENKIVIFKTTNDNFYQIYWASYYLLLCYCGVYENIIIIGDLSETNMPHRRPTCKSLFGISTHLNFFFFFFLLIFIHFGIIYWGMSISDGSLMKHVEVFDQTCRSSMGLR